MVDVLQINKLLAYPEDIHEDHLSIIKNLIEKYPYFQAVRSIYLKGLKNINSPIYNKELQNTAAHTTDRSVLFDFITSTSFVQQEVSEHIKLILEGNNLDAHLEVTIPETENVQHAKKAIREEDFNASKDFTQVTKSDLFEKKKESIVVDEPLNFKQDEHYSFSQWLQLTSLKPIERVKNISQEEDHVAPATITDANPEFEESKWEIEERERKMARIDQFLAEKPKIKPRKSASGNMIVASQYEDPNQFMTETLAKVYLAQKNYSKALKAYEVLVLQHPEKSGLFANQIKEIKNLLSNNL
jgi:hypothetical protein